MRQLVYDSVMRIFHWSFALFFLTAFVIAKTIESDSPTYPYHMLAGLMLVVATLLRITWGFGGSKYSRFKSFPLHPRHLFQYFTAILTGKRQVWAGHNPASSWAGITMMVLASGLGLTGILMANDFNKESIEDIHELFANAFILVVIAHIAGLAFHMFRHQDGLALSMIDGKKSALTQSDAIRNGHFLSGLAYVALLVGFAIYLNKQYDSQKQTLNLFGTTLVLGENESEGPDHE